MCAINQSRKKQGSLTYVTDRESEVGKIFILSLYSSMDKILISFCKKKNVKKILGSKFDSP